jgi:glycerophosphoryl diester phosphodiesterase
MRKILKTLLKIVSVFFGALTLGFAGLYVSLAISDGEAATPADVYRDSKRTPLVLAHRGGADLRPENTFEAYDHAVDIGVDVLEIDVRISKDGEFVVIHDSTVDRTTDGTGRVEDKTVAELRSLDAGFKFTTDNGTSFPFRGKGIRIPTFRETLERYKGRNINIEVKQAPGEKSREFCETLRGRIDPKQTVVASASGDFLYPFRDTCPEYTTSATFTEVLDFLTRHKLGVSSSYSPAMRFLQIPAGFRYLTILDRSFASSAKSKGLGIHVWTINDANEMRRLIRLGVDGIVTDKPDLLIKVIEEESGAKRISQ